MATVGVCNICGQHGALTADHVPPKGASGLSAAELETLVRFVAVDPQRPPSKFHQNGVKFRTLCGDCNNGRLGGQYDPSLIEISKDVSRIVRMNTSGVIAFPPEIKIRTRVHRVARAVVGHLLAVLPKAHRGKDLVHGHLADAMREYFLDTSKPLPPQMSIYYWIYPSELHVVARGFGMIDIRSPQSCIVGDMIKFFPLGYWVTWDQPSSVQIRLPELISRRSWGIDDEEEISIRLHDVPPPGWPERPGDWGMNLFHEEMTFVAYPRKRRRKRTGS